MTLEFEGIFFVSWFFKIFILSYISRQKLNLYYLILPFLFLAIYIVRYDIVFWGEILFLPVSLFFVKKRFGWTWLQYIFYSLFPFVIFDIFSNFANLYNRFVFQASAEKWYNFFWSDWIDKSIGFLLCFGFFKLLRIDFKEFGIQLSRKTDFQKNFSILTYSLIFYGGTVYLINNLIFLTEGGQFFTNLDLIYLRRHLLNFYLIFIIGMFFYINHYIKESKDKELQQNKDKQLQDLIVYSQHVESLYKEIRSFRHDYTNIIVSFNEAIKNRDIESVESIYESILEGSDRKFYDSKYDIGELSNLIDISIKSVVSAKLIEAQSKGIDISVEVIEPIGRPQMEMIDFITILTILLDNAVEAAVKSVSPVIQFAFFQEGDEKILFIKNSTDKDKINTKNIFKYGETTKGSGRGIGLYNVKQILSKYPEVFLETESINYRFTQELHLE